MNQGAAETVDAGAAPNAPFLTGSTQDNDAKDAMDGIVGPKFTAWSRDQSTRMVMAIT